MENLRYIEKFLKSCVDTKNGHILCGRTKHTIQEYKPWREALKSYDFIRFGNKFFIPSISIDMDYAMDMMDIFDIADENKIPKPSLIVYTNRGQHLHWVLKNPIQVTNKKSVKLYNIILEELCKIYDSDTFAKAKNAGRVWRNPVTHDITFNDRKYDLFSFKKIIPKIEVDKNKKFEKKKDGVKNIDWGDVKEGYRHMTMFNFLRYKAYRNKNKVNDLYSFLHIIAVSCNNKMPHPLPKSEIDNLVNSISNWIDTKYGGIGGKDQAEFNRQLAQKKVEQSIQKFILFLVENPFVTIKILKSKSLRALSKLIGLSHTCISKYMKQIELIVKYFLQKSNSSVESVANYIVKILNNQLVPFTNIVDTS